MVAIAFPVAVEGSAEVGPGKYQNCNAKQHKWRAKLTQSSIYVITFVSMPLSAEMTPHL
jgi:hypothetical protein